MSTINYVNLGLPSGTLWADRNLGAEKEEDPGMYFRWADTKGHSKSDMQKGEGFYLNNRKYIDEKLGKDVVSKYSKKDKLTVLKPEDDAVSHLSGSPLEKIPNLRDFKELIEYTDFIDIPGVGWKFINRSNPQKYILIPYNGYASGHLPIIPATCKETNLWLSQLDTNNEVRALSIYFKDNNKLYKVIKSDRFYGYGIRGIKVRSIPTIEDIMENINWIENPIPNEDVKNITFDQFPEIIKNCKLVIKKILDIKNSTNEEEIKKYSDIKIEKLQINLKPFKDYYYSKTLKGFKKELDKIDSSTLEANTELWIKEINRIAEIIDKILENKEDKDLRSILEKEMRNKFKLLSK